MQTWISDLPVFFSFSVYDESIAYRAETPFIRNLIQAAEKETRAAKYPGSPHNASSDYAESHYSLFEVRRAGRCIAAFAWPEHGRYAEFIDVKREKKSFSKYVLHILNLQCRIRLYKGDVCDCT